MTTLITDCFRIKYLCTVPQVVVSHSALNNITFLFIAHQINSVQSHGCKLIISYDYKMSNRIRKMHSRPSNMTGVDFGEPLYIKRRVQQRKILLNGRSILINCNRLQ